MIFFTLSYSMVFALPWRLKTFVAGLTLSIHPRGCVRIFRGEVQKNEARRKNSKA